MKNHNNKIFVLILMLLVPLPPGLTVIYTPAMPKMASDLFVSHTFIQLSITSYYLTYCVSQLIWGPLSDRYGRKKTLIVSFLVLLFTSLALAMTHSIGSLLFLRGIQGIGAACIAVNFKALMVEKFEGESLFKVSAIINGAFTLGPVIAPFIGSLLSYYFNWTAIFIFLAFYISILLLMIIFLLPETLYNQKNHSIHSVIKNYSVIFSNQYFWRSILALGLTVSLFFSFNLFASFYFIETLKITEIQFGCLAAFVGIGCFLGAFLNRILLNFMSPEKLILSGALTVLCSGLLLTVLIYFHSTNSVILSMPSWIAALADSAIFSNLMIRLLQRFDSPKGIMSASIGVGLGMTVSIFTIILSYIHPTSLVPLALILIILGVMIYVLTKSLSRQKSIAH